MSNQECSCDCCRIACPCCRKSSQPKESQSKPGTFLNPGITKEELNALEEITIWLIKTGSCYTNRKIFEKLIERSLRTVQCTPPCGDTGVVKDEHGQEYCECKQSQPERPLSLTDIYKALKRYDDERVLAVLRYAGYEISERLTRHKITTLGALGEQL